MGKEKKPPARGAGKGQQRMKGSTAEAGSNVTTNSPATQDDRPPTDYLNAPAVPNTDAAMAFLILWAPDGPWMLTAINPNKKDIQGRLFTKKEFGDMLTWIKARSGKLNLYFSVNSVMQKEFLEKENKKQKAGREHIKSMDWLHVDIDIRLPNPALSAEELAAHNRAELERILSLLTTNLPAGVPPPSVIVFSGGGYQAYWKLAEPIPINGQEAAYEDAKLYNLHLENVFDGDDCHNVDRIMRLPGSVNLPDAKKLKKGRKPALACVVRPYA